MRHRCGRALARRILYNGSRRHGLCRRLLYYLSRLELLHQPLLADLCDLCDSVAFSNLARKAERCVLFLPVNVRVIGLIIGPVIEAIVQAAAKTGALRAVATH